MKATYRIGISLFLLFISLTQHSFAGEAASIRGTVKDTQGNGIPGAAVTIVAHDGGTSADTTSDATGAYHFDGLMAGEYILQSQAAGFGRYVEGGIHLDRGAGLELDIPLQLAVLQQTVVVTAAGTPQTGDETSKSVSVVDRQQMDDRNDVWLANALRYTPGLRVQQLGGPGAFTNIRLRGLRNQDTEILVDGLRFRDASATQADASGFLEDLLVTNVNRVEVLRGSGSSLYGTNAIGGAINIITDEGGGRTHGSVLLSGGSLGLFRGRAQLAGGLRDDRIQYSAGLADLNVTEGVDGNSPARNRSGQGRVNIRVSPGTQLVARLYGADSYSMLNSSPSGAGLVPPTGIINAVPLSPSQLRLYQTGTPLSSLALGSATFIPSTNDPDSNRAARFLSGALMFSSHPTDAVSFSASYQGVATIGTYRNGPAGEGYQPLGGTRTDLNGRTDTVNGRMDYQLARSNLLSGGYEFESENIESINIDKLDAAATATAAVTQRSNTLFVQDQQRLFGDRLQLSGAFRAEWFMLESPQFTPATAAPYGNSSFPATPAAYTGDGSIAYFVRNRGTKFRAHVGRGYRAPSLYERFGTGFDGEFGYSVYGDPRLQPEHSISFDGGIDQTLIAQRLKVSATYFYTRLQNVIVFDFSGAINFQTDPFGRFGGYRNSAGGLARGVETSAVFSVSRSLDASLSYTYTNAIERTPTVQGILPSFLAPKHQFSGVVTQRIGRRVTTVVDVIAAGSYLAPLFGTTTRAYRFAGAKKVGLTASYRLPLTEFKAMRFFAKADNIFNQTYYESGFRTPGVTGTGGLQFEF